MVNFIAIFLTTRLCSEPQIKHCAKPQHVSANSMKTSLSLFILFLFPFLCFGKCLKQNPIFLSSSDTINSNAKIIIDFYDYNKFLEDYPKHFSILIISKEKSYDLKLINLVKGYSQTQATFLLPERILIGQYDIALKPKTLELAYEIGDVRNASGFMNIILKNIYVTNIKNNISGNWGNEIELKQAKSAWGGCFGGTKFFNEFFISNTFDPNMLFEITLISKEPHPKTIIAYIINKNQNLFNIGHDFCYGTFNLDTYVDYKVIIRAYSQKLDSYSEPISCEIEKKNWKHFDR